MSKIRVKDIYIGKPDARDEVTTEGEENFIESFVTPPQFDFEGLINGSKYFIRGYKGTGKTALLYYLDSMIKDKDQMACTSYIFFKSDFSTIHRENLQSISNRIINSITIQKDTYKINQDFEHIWKWLLFKRIIEDNEYNNYGIFINDSNWYKFKNIVESILCEKKRSFMLQSKVEISLNYLFIDGSSVAPKVLLDFDNKDNMKQYSIFVELIEEATNILSTLTRGSIPYYIFIDELEAFYGEKEILIRDLKMLRDLIITTKKLNVYFDQCGFTKFKIICSVRTEILNSITRFIPGKEINKITSGYECNLIWDYNNTNSYNHPIFKIWLRRIQMAEKKNNNFLSFEEIYKKWFPEKIDNVEVVNYILNSSWSKPRDIVRFLTATSNCLHSASTSYTQAVFDASMKEYSKESMKEIIEELIALYSSEEINKIINCLTGFKPTFSYSEIKNRIDVLFKGTFIENNLVAILTDLYRLGILGNYSLSSKNHRWQHKSDDRIVIDDDWLIVVHRALHKALSLSVRYGRKRSSMAYIDKIKSGEIVDVRVNRINKFFLLVEFYVDSIKQSGSVHISELSYDYVNDINQFANIGDRFKAKVLNYNNKYNNWNITLKVD